MSVYAEAARVAGHITEAERLLRQAAEALVNPSLRASAEPGGTKAPIGASLCQEITDRKTRQFAIKIQLLDLP
ncbi:hypothetical protein [Mesorhizobium tamadayense]|uniref:hypothetical protein n=1 Tax=Mesorhizobium tamadayense TaxID=425306 RepID=UPI003CCB20A5